MDEEIDARRALSEVEDATSKCSIYSRQLEVMKAKQGELLQKLGVCDIVRGLSCGFRKPRLLDGGISKTAWDFETPR